MAGSNFAEKFLRVGMFVGFLRLFRRAKTVFNSVACVGLVAGNMGYQKNIVGVAGGGNGWPDGSTKSGCTGLSHFFGRAFLLWISTWCRPIAEGTY